MRVAVLVCVSLALAGAAAEPFSYNYGFETDLYGMMVMRGKWHWSNRDNLGWQVPAGITDGFAVYTEEGDGDVFFPIVADTEFGLSYSIQYFVSSKVVAGTTFELHLLNSKGEFLKAIRDLSSYSQSNNTQWKNVTGTVPATKDGRLGVFCKTPRSNPNNGGFMWGCAVDSMTIASPGEIVTSPTEAPTTTHAPPPSLPTEVFSFDNGTAGWVLGQANGAAWMRTNHYITNGNPPNHEVFLAVYPTDHQPGVVMAMSPRMKVSESGLILVTATFLMTGSSEYPASLKFRRSTSYDVYDAVPCMNLDPWGEQENQHWITHTAIPISKLEPGQEFNLIMEANLGIDGRNKIAVSEITVQGVELVPQEEEAFFDFSNGLVGWSQGAVEGGHFVLKDHGQVNPNFHMPAPSIGDNVLTLERYDIHSGVMTIESPPMTFDYGTIKTAHVRFWMRGSRFFPTSLRVKIKNNESNKYSDLPFVDFTPYGNNPMYDWLDLDAAYPVETQNFTGFYQLVIEADLGADMNNMVAIDAIRVSTKPIA